MAITDGRVIGDAASSGAHVKRPGLHAWLAVIVGLAALCFALAATTLTNDHFGRISPAWQIATYGDFPFRDFLDPGYFLTEFASAALLRIFGNTLLGEWLLTSSFIAGGAVIVMLLAFRVSDSYPIALTAAAVSLLSLPRAYDFDKVLFYPLGLLLCFRYADLRATRTLWALAAGLVLAALFRYDTGVYIGCATLTVIGITHAGDWKTAARRAAVFTLAVFCLSLPVLGFLQYEAGVLDAADQMVTYGKRETERTRISRPLGFSVGRLVGFPSVDAASTRILIRWAASVDEPSRRALESRYRLQDGTLERAEQNRTWSYLVDDSSIPNLRALGEDPHVEDTQGVDRGQLVLSETFLTRVGRKIPLLPEARTFDNANAFLYHFLRWLPLLAAVILLRGVLAQTPVPRADLARVASLIVMCVLLNIFILRDPVDARVGGMAGPAAVLSAWTASHVWDIRPRVVRYAVTVGAVLIMWLTLWSLSTAMEWERRLNTETLSPANVRGLAAAFGESPPSLQAYPNRNLIGLVNYLRECTSVNDRVFAAWFVPELYYFAQRGFVGSVATFDKHWSEPRFQQRIIDAFSSHAVPVVITETARHEDFVADYSLLGDYLEGHFNVAGTTDFGNPGGNYTVLVDKNRIPARTHPATGMPCF